MLLTKKISNNVFLDIYQDKVSITKINNSTEDNLGSMDILELTEYEMYRIIEAINNNNKTN